MNTILNSGGIKDAIGVLLVVITGLLYATGVTETATDVVRDVGLDESSVGAAIEVPQGASARSSSPVTFHRNYACAMLRPDGDLEVSSSGPASYGRPLRQRDRKVPFGSSLAS